MTAKKMVSVIWTTQFCSLWTVCLEWCATDPACITRHTQTVSKHTVDNAVLFSLRNMIWRFRDCLGRWNSAI